MSINDLYFRPFDKARLDRLTEAIVQEKLSAALVSESEGLLDHYGRILVQRLRERNGINVEVYYPNSTEALITRFNKILENISVDAATKTVDSNAPQRVLVAFDSHATGLREVQLMARLVRDFPGANTRIILLLDKRSSTQVEKKIEAFGNKIVRWDISTPTQREASVLLSESELTGMEPEVRQALENVGVSLDAKLALAASNRAINKAEEEMQKNENPVKNENKIDDKTENDNDIATYENTPQVDQPVKQETDESKISVKEKSQAKRKNQINAILALCFVFAISAGVVSYLQNSGLLSLSSMLEDARKLFLQSELIDNPSLPIKNQDRVSVLENQDDQFSLLSGETTQDTNKIDETILSQQEEYLDEEALPEDPIQVISENTSDEKPKTELIKNTIDPGFYVQHTARGDLESVLEIQRGYPALQNSIILKLKKTQVEGFFYVLLSGPFETLDDANVFTTRDDIPRETWIRGALSIRPLIAAP